MTWHDQYPVIKSPSESHTIMKPPNESHKIIKSQNRRFERVAIWWESHSQWIWLNKNTSPRRIFSPFSLHHLMAGSFLRSWELVQKYIGTAVWLNMAQNCEGFKNWNGESSIKSSKLCGTIHAQFLRHTRCLLWQTVWVKFLLPPGSDFLSNTQTNTFMHQLSCLHTVTKASFFLVR